MLTWIELFVASFVIFALPAVWLIASAERARRKRIAQILDASIPDAVEARPQRRILDLAQKRKTRLERLAESAPLFSALPAMLDRAGGGWNLRGVLLAAASLAAGGGLLAQWLASDFGWPAVALAVLVSGSAPVLLLRRRSERQLRAFEQQLPDAVEFLARSVRTGNAFAVSLEMLIPETAEPARSELLRVTREHALGAPLETALRKLVARVPLLELRFFVAAVLLQRETGGNLAEILDKLSWSIRERLRLKSQVRATSAQGRLTARILSILPMVVLLLMSVISPKYTGTMTSDPAGRAILLGAVVSQLIGYGIMKRITDIEI
jgi:tight adherence protein B